MESMPRRARHLISLDLPHRREVMAACAVLLVVAHLLVAQLTLGLAVAFTLIGRASRWRLWWLTGPAAAGLAWALVAGPAQAAAGFAAGSAHVLDYLGQGQLAQRLGHPLGAFAGAGGWLPRQLPIALISGAAEAAIIGWLGWLHTDELAVPPRRPGAVAAIRASLAAALIRSGSVVTREGCALGVDPATGAVVDLRWREIAGGVLVVGTAATGGDGDRSAGGARRAPPPQAGHRHRPERGRRHRRGAERRLHGHRHPPARGRGRGSRAGGAGAFGRAAPGPLAEVAVRACGAIGALGRNLRRIGVDGDGLVWIPGCDSLPAAALVPLISAGGAAGLPVLMTTTSAAAARELAGLVGVVLIHRLADPTAAAGWSAWPVWPRWPARGGGPRRLGRASSCWR